MRPRGRRGLGADVARDGLSTGSILDTAIADEQRMPLTQEDRLINLPIVDSAVDRNVDARRE